MVTRKVVETIASAAAEAAEQALPARVAMAAEAVAGKLATGAGKGASNPAAAEILGSMKITDQVAATVVNQQRVDIIKANEALVGHVTKLMPQVQQGNLDWILGGSSAVNALAAARKITILDAGKLPAIVPGKTITLSEQASNSFGSFVRRVDDVDAFVVNGGKNKFLESPYLVSAEINLPEAAHGALRAVGEARSSRLVQGVKMEFDHPEVAALEYAGKTVFVTGPGQLMTNKMRQVLLSYSPADSRKMTGDFAHLLDAAASIYPEKSLLQFGRQALQRNDLLYKKEVLVPWEKTAENSKFIDYLRKVLESEERNGTFLKGLKIDSADSITAMRVLERHQRTGDKAALAGFINRNSEFVRKLDVKGSAEHTMFRSQGGMGKASDTMFTALDSIPTQARSGMLRQHLRDLETQLAQTKNLPALMRSVIAKGGY